MIVAMLPLWFLSGEAQAAGSESAPDTSAAVAVPTSPPTPGSPTHAGLHTFPETLRRAIDLTLMSPRDQSPSPLHRATDSRPVHSRCSPNLRDLRRSRRPHRRCLRQRGGTSEPTACAVRRRSFAHALRLVHSGVEVLLLGPIRCARSLGERASHGPGLRDEGGHSDPRRHGWSCSRGRLGWCVRATVADQDRSEDSDLDGAPRQIPQSTRVTLFSRGKSLASLG